MLMDDILRQSADHPKYGELSEMEESRARQAASKEEYDCARGAGEEPLEIHDYFLMMLFNDVFFRLKEN